MADIGEPAFIKVQSVTKTYGPVRALVGVTCAFQGGEISVVEGANGSGKSTLLGIVGTLVRPTGGGVSYGVLGKGRERVRSTIGWVGHDSLCYADLTGQENIEFAARLYGRDPREAFELASDRFQLGAFAARPLRTCSRGQRQRVALARALVHAPKLILLDEPTTGLDAVAIERLAAVVRAESDRGAVVIVVTHDPVFAERVGNARMRMENGRATQLNR